MTGVVKPNVGAIRTGWVIATLTNLLMYAEPDESKPKAFKLDMICVSVLVPERGDSTSHEEDRWVVVNRHLLPTEYFGHTHTENLHPFDSEGEAWITFIQALRDLQVEERARAQARADEVSALRTYAWRKANTIRQLAPLAEATHANT